MFYVKYVMGETCVVAGTVLDDVMGGTYIIPGTALDVMGETCIIPGTALDVMGETCIIPGTALASQAFSCTLQQTRITMPKPELLSELPPETRNQNYTRTRIATFGSNHDSGCSRDR
jgi:hypothetical protein